MLLKAIQKLTLNTIGIFVNIKSASAYCIDISWGVVMCATCKLLCMLAWFLVLIFSSKTQSYTEQKYRAFRFLNWISRDQFPEMSCRGREGSETSASLGTLFVFA